MLDLCCSYGFNAMLLNHTASLWQLRARYQDPALDEVAPADLIAQDRDFYASLRRQRAQIRGLDISQPAIDYATGAACWRPGGPRTSKSTPRLRAWLKASAAPS
ncbi:hypothetical protein [Nesterenkonia pannonica]|uniref:hypothetical protein n=1 Tax=Nesterenkonia pannonica TaxID=1548602 RepID=UPI002164A31E|nr:hypothetical protein [Nesterenkonia pannonica]